VKEVVEMWKYSKMIAGFVLAAAVYAVVLWVFAPLWIIPGVTGIRIANILPPVFSLLFGPAAAWGIAVGNLIGYDILGGALTIGSIGGFIGNFLLGFMPYKIWHRMFKEPPHCRSISSILKFEFVTLIHAAICAHVISLWCEAVGFVPYTPLAFIIFTNDFIAPAIAGPILMTLIYDRVRRAGWLWTDVMKGYEYTPSEVKKRWMLGTILVTIGSIVGLIATVGVGLGLGQPLFFGPGLKFIGTPLVVTGLVFLIVWAVGVALLG